MFRITDVRDGNEKMIASGVLGKISFVVIDTATNEDEMYIHATVFQAKNGSIYVKSKFDVRKGNDGKTYADISFTNSFSARILAAAKTWASSNNRTVNFLGATQGMPATQAHNPATSGPLF